MKKFLKKTEGFTLVELIVVIAILGILAGVAVPAYSGYLKKANEAADTQILSAMNTAFAAACTENSVVPADVDDVAVTVAAKKVTGITVTDSALSDEVKGDIEDDFLVYFAGNTDSELKYYAGFDFSGGNFVGTES